MLSNLEAAIVRNPLVIGEDATVLSAVEQMNALSKQATYGGNPSSTCVVIASDELKVLGVLTQQDVMRLVSQQQPIAQLTLKQFWQSQSPSPSLIISQSDLTGLRNINAAIAYFESLQITHLAIVDRQDQLIGVIQHDSLKRLRDKTIHQATASLFAVQQKIHERIAQAEPLSEVLGDLLLTMETHLRGASCSITLCQDGRLSDVIAPSLPQDYAVVVEKANLPIAEGVGSCGTAMFRGELVMVKDIANEPLWQDYKNFALPYGLQACSSIPIFASDRTLLGAFGIYYHEQKAPQDQELEWIAQAANIAGIAIERDQAAKNLQKLNQDLENRVQVRTQELQEREQFLQTVLDTFPLSVFWKDVNSVYLGCNQNFLRDAGLQTIAQIIGKTDYQLPWGETEADIYQSDDRAVIESQTAKLGIVETQYQGNGQTIWVETNKLPLRNLQGEIIGILGTYQDISDRKAAELAVQVSEAKFRRITESVPGMIFRYVLHPDGHDELVYVSPQVQQIYELTPEVVIQDLSCLWARFHPEDIPMIQSAIQDSAASLQPFFIEGRLLLPNERVKWIQVSSQPDRQKNGDVIWDGVVIDISDRKNAEKKLQELSERLELAIQSAQIGIWEFDFSSNRLFWDKRMLEIHGVSPEAFHGTYEDWSSRVHPDDLLKAQPNLSEEQVNYSTEFRIIRPDGVVRWIMVCSFSQRDLQGKLLRIVGVNLDISDRKNAELTLQDLSDRLEFALKGAKIGIWEWQINEGRLLWDERMFTLYGIPPEKFSGKYADWFQCIHPDDQDWVQQAEQQAPHGAKECHVEFRIIRPDGTIRFIDSYVFNQYNAQGEIQKKVGLNIDISDRKQAELQLHRINEELIKATRLKDEFLANMSHELRTPLNAILGMTEILQEGIFGDLNSRQLQSLHTIEKSSNHLLELINDILDVAKIEAGKIKLSCEPNNIEALCQSSLVFIKQQAFGKKIQLESEIPANLPSINLDERRIRQVLINLLNNAVKFTPNGGKINLKVNHISFLNNTKIPQSGTACDIIEISVVDTGIGIAPDQIKRLFQPFMQVESAINRNYEGSGLGLVLVKRLVELHGGDVRLTSELGAGSCFTIALPIVPFCELSIVPEPTPPMHHETSEPASTDAPIILLAEDNEANIEVFVEYLSLKGYRLVVAKNGLMAIDLAQRTHPDLILMDIQMPEMDGLEAIQRIRQIPRLASTPIIALTALAMSGDRDRCIAVGANDYLSKPVSMKELVKKINGYLSKP